MDEEDAVMINSGGSNFRNESVLATLAIGGAAAADNPF